MSEDNILSEEHVITYEDFGATGDGVTDDLPAICEAHKQANERGFPVRTRAGVTYHLGRRDLTAVIGTDTDWGTSRFTIDDTEVENHKTPLFAVRSLLEPLPPLKIDRLSRDQRQLDARPDSDVYVRVESDESRVYIRRGLNQSLGTPLNDAFILRRDGSIEGDIDWDYTSISRMEVRPIDERILVVRGGVFSTIANRMPLEPAYQYWGRGIVVERSNTEVAGVTHYIMGETEEGQPYSGFLTVRKCANVTLKDCFLSGHRTYVGIGSAGKPVSMGSYDITANSVVNFRMIGCRMNHINDRTRWGVIGSNFCKNILLENCTLSRMDTHMGVSGTYIIRGTTIGYVGINAIGRGELILEDTTSYGKSLISFRGDYGSTWSGNVTIRNCRWIPECGDMTWPNLIHTANDSRHDFGYPCSMPTAISIEGLVVDDRNHPDDYQGMYILSDPEDMQEEKTGPLAFPYRPCETVTIRKVETMSGLPAKLSPNADVIATTRLVVLD